MYILLYFFDDYSSGVVDFYDTQQPKLIGSGVALNEWIAGCNLNKTQKCYLKGWRWSSILFIEH